MRTILTSLGLVVFGVILSICGYALSNMAYNQGGGTYIYFYPVRYYGGIAFMIVEVLFAIIGLAFAFLGGASSLQKVSMKKEYGHRKAETCEYFRGGQCNMTNLAETRKRMFCLSNQKEICCHACKHYSTCQSRCSLRLAPGPLQ